MAMLCAFVGGVGLGGNSFIDIIAPLYTIFIGSLILTKFYEKNQFDENPIVESVASSNVSAGGGGPKAVADLVESSSGKNVPGILELIPSNGSPSKMVSLSCCLRLKKVAGFNVKIYVLGIFIERSEKTVKILEQFKTKVDAGIYDAILSTEPSKFFSRALYMSFCRGVTGKQVAESLAERLKANVPPEAFSAFSNTLLDGIGSKGLASGETLSFHWYEPESLRIYVRGVDCGEVKDSKLPRAIHAGFLGNDPALPEAKKDVMTGLPRLFQSVGNGGGGTKRAGKALVPATIKEPASGILFPSFIDLGTDGPLSMRVLSCGIQVKKVAGFGVQVYAGSILVEPEGAKTHLEKWFNDAASSQSAQSSGSPKALFETLLSKEVFFPRAIHLIFCRNVTGKQVADSLAERLKANVSAEGFTTFSEILLKGIGSGLNKGETLSYLWAEPELLKVFVRGEFAGDVRDVKLPKATHTGFLGENDPNAPAAKEGVPKAIISLFNNK